ncbi:MAG TPA: caspase family protein, partial [Thermoanaerobaculia bacterium]|nr:caspase family protein [Thermoanaerobaculia bacterium]
KVRRMLCIVVLLAIALPIVIVYGRRSVRPMPPRQPDPLGQFDPAQSAALVVGIRNFKELMVPVQYGPDDAVDLAYAFTRNGLVPPERIVIVLSGVPLNDESKQWLEELRAAGAKVTTNATRDRIEKLLKQQIDTVGADGLLLLAFATHGFSQDGVPYLLAQSSVFRDPATSLSVTKIADDAAASKARRSLIFVDACRERVSATTRSLLPEPASMGALIKGMSRAEGQVVFYAAAAGQYAFDDDERMNGAFTATVLEGLRCRARKNSAGCVTVDSLETYVNTSLRKWLREKKGLDLKSAIQVSADSGTRAMPLVACERALDSFILPPRVNPAIVSFTGSVLDVRDKKNRQLWVQHLKEPITKAEIDDLDNDRRSEVIVSTASGIFVFKSDSTPAWSFDAPVRAFGTEKFFHGNKNRQIAALSSSHIALFDNIGQKVMVFAHGGRVNLLRVAGETSRHLPKIVAATANEVLLLEPKTGKPAWRAALQRPGEVIRDIEIADYDGDKRSDIAVRTSKGESYLTFDGKTIEGKGSARLTLFATK